MMAVFKTRGGVSNLCIRVLQVVSVMDRGGEETMIMNYYRHMDRHKVQFDFLVHQEKRGIYEDEIERLGGKIYRAFPIRPWNYSKYRKWLDAFFKEHREFKAVHAHILENCGFVLQAADNAGIPIRVAHSHLAKPTLDYKYLFRQYGKYILRKANATKYFGCGKDAGNYLFDGKPFEVLPNAIDTSQFSYDPKIRGIMRQQLGVSEKLVLGNVARFHPVKNQSYLIDIFAQVREKQLESVLLLVGIGEEQETVKNKVTDLGLESSVYFLNVRTDVNQLLQAMDVFVFPSKLEGLPLSLIEAQAAALPCILSDRVARETAITDLVEFVSLDKGPEYWAERVIEAANRVRKDITEQIKEAHYDIIENAAWLQKFYLGEVQ